MSDEPMLLQDVDIYVLVKERSRKYIERFFNEWAYNPVESTEDYAYPNFSWPDSEIVFKSADELINRLLDDPNADYSIYWDNGAKDSGIRMVMLFFTADAGMIVGIGIWSNDREWEDQLLSSVAETVEGEYGYISYSVKPPFDTAAEFQKEEFLIRR